MCSQLLHVLQPPAGVGQNIDSHVFLVLVVDAVFAIGGPKRLFPFFPLRVRKLRVPADQLGENLVFSPRRARLGAVLLHTAVSQTW